jgi:prepilin peptidase CpaA
MTLPTPAIRVLLTAMVILAAFFDIRQHRVPNWLTLPGVLLGIALNTFLSFFAMAGLLYSLKGMALAFAVYFVLYLLRGMGAGDVKLMAAVGAAAGWQNWLGILFLTAILGGAVALILATSKGRIRRTFQNMWLLLASLRQGRAPYRDNPELDVGNERALRLPHAVMIACGTLGFLGSALLWAPRLS